MPEEVWRNKEFDDMKNLSLLGNPLDFKYYIDF